MTCLLISTDYHSLLVLNKAIIIGPISQVPLEGFKHLIGMRGPQNFSIHRAEGGERLPTAHTCFNQLDLPEYPKKGQ